METKIKTKTKTNIKTNIKKNIEIFIHKEIEGYFTVEAAMILPMVLMTIVLIMYLLFFQYNRCLMEQDIGILTLRGIALQVEDNQDRMKQLKEQAAGLYDEKYIAWENSEIELTLEKGTICVEQSGWIKFPFWGGIFKENRVWTTSVIDEKQIISPVSFVRNCRKIAGGE